MGSLQPLALPLARPPRRLRQPSPSGSPVPLELEKVYSQGVGSIDCLVTDRSDKQLLMTLSRLIPLKLLTLMLLMLLMLLTLNLKLCMPL